MPFPSESSTSSRSQARLRVLALHAKIVWRRDEASEVWEHITGVLEADNAGAVEVKVSDGRTVYGPVMDGAEMRLRPIGSLIGALFRGVDVLHVHHVLPTVRHLTIASLFRLRGSKIVLSPHAFLTDDFTRRSWTHPRPWLWSGLKPTAVRMLRSAWTAVAHSFVCLSRLEVTTSHLPEARCVLLPFAKPDSPLLDGDPSPVDPSRDRSDAPMLFISRMDPWRKGIDRLCDWLSLQPSLGPRPSAVLLAPRDGHIPSEVDDLVRAGSLRWDPHTRGADLLGLMRDGRGVMLLSRYEGQPRSLREAMWIGLPIICTTACHLDEVTSVLGTGRIVAGDDPAEIQSAFEALAADDGAPEQARLLFDRKEIGRFLVSVLVDVAAGRSPKERDYYRSFQEAAART